MSGLGGGSGPEDAAAPDPGGLGGAGAAGAVAGASGGAGGPEPSGAGGGGGPSGGGPGGGGGPLGFLLNKLPNIVATGLASSS